MRAVVLTRHGGPEVLRIRDVPKPEPKRGEVRVQVDCIGINFAEVLSRRGVYGWAPPLPYILGMEAAGIDEATGDRVVVGTKFGTYAEFICVPADRVFPAPARFSLQECAAFPVNYLTAWIGLMEMARLRPADTLLVTSAAGGVGTAAVQIGVKSGARVIGAAGPGKQDIVRELGATAVDYTEPGWDERIGSVDVVLENAGGAIYRAAVRRLAPMGRIVMAGASGAFPHSRNLFARIAALRNMPRPSTFEMVRRSYGVMNFHVGRLLESGAIAPRWRALAEFVEQHQICPVIAKELAFDDIADAHRMLEERRNIGKVVVRVAPHTAS